VSNVNLSECLDGRRTDADGGRTEDGRGRRTDGRTGHSHKEIQESLNNLCSI
jgi:hypothetical protein